jgi:ferric iron reductase protein FhuF
MMTQAEMIKLALKAGTKERARELVDQQVSEMVDVLQYAEPEARRITLVNIGYYTGYLDHETADKIMDLFETEHPIFGRTHPSPEEAFRLGRELGERMKQREIEKEKD